MKIGFKQESYKWNFKYTATFTSGKVIHAVANRTLLPTPRKVNFQNEENNIYMKEKRILLKVLDIIPLLSFLIRLFIYKRDKYQIYQSNEKIGRIEWYRSFRKDIISIDYKQRNYQVYNRSKGRKIRFYIFEGNEQIGIIDKNYITKNRADEYKGEFNYNTDEMLNIIIFTFIDLSKYSIDVTTSMEFISYEKEYTLFQLTNRKLDVDLNDDWQAKQI